MTDEQTILRLVKTVDSIAEWRSQIDVQRAAEAERWKAAVSDIHSIKEELRSQGAAQEKRHIATLKRYNWAMGIILLPIVGAFVKFILDGGLSGH